MRPGTENAVAVAVAIAADHGLRCDDPAVIRDAWHVLVHLRPLPLVARVSSSLPYPEGPPADGVVRELAVAAHAARNGAPVVPPADVLDPGPHNREGRVVTFWQYAPADGELDARAAGSALRAVHEALVDFPGQLEELHTADTRSLLDLLEPSADVELLRELAARRPGGPGQAVHGDAHLFNCLQRPAGPLWHDFETACRGPRELDLAALVFDHRLQDGAPEAQVALAATASTMPTCSTSCCRSTGPGSSRRSWSRNAVVRSSRRGHAATSTCSVATPVDRQRGRARHVRCLAPDTGS